MNNKIVIELTDEQNKQYNDWCKSFGELPYLGPFGGHFGLDIIFTSVGPIISAKSWNGKKINLVDINF